MEYKDHMHPNPFTEARLRECLTRHGFRAQMERVNTDHKSHPMALGEYRGLLSRE